MEKTYLYLYPDTFLWTQKKEGLVYNSKNNCIFRFNNNTIRDTIQSLQDMKNLYCVEISNIDAYSVELKKFINSLEKCKAGKLVRMSEDCPKPVVLPPLLNLQYEIARLQKESPEMVGENISDYLHELTVWINTVSDHTGMIESINTNTFNRILNIASNSHLSHIHLKGTDIFEFSGLVRFMDILEQMESKKSVYVKLENLNQKVLSKNIFSSSQFVLVIEVKNFENLQKINEIASKINKQGINAQWTFQIRNEEEYQKAEIWIERYSLVNTEIKPVYTCENLQFFENNIYLTEEDLKTPILSKREVFAHQALNTNDFGKLTITPDGKVYANPYFPTLGFIEDDLRELIYKELTVGQSWRRIRDMKPCCDCVYQWLCPSPSDYELAIGKPNLCHIEP